MNEALKNLPGLPIGKLIRANTCGNCKWGVAVPRQQQLACKESPPTPTVFMVPGPAGQSQFITHTGFPMVAADEWCGKWAPKIEKVN